MRSGIKVVLFFVIASALLGFTLPIAEGEISWNGFLKEVGFNPPTVYEVSADGVILEGEQFATNINLLCLDGDWVNEVENNLLGYRIDGDNLMLPGNEIVFAMSDNILEMPPSDFHPRNVIGQSMSVSYENAQPEDAGAPFDIPFTVTILCLSPSSMMTVGGEWQATDNVALIIGYSVLNAYWLAPIGIGIGLGIYLVKRRF